MIASVAAGTAWASFSVRGIDPRRPMEAARGMRERWRKFLTILDSGPGRRWEHGLGSAGVKWAFLLGLVGWFGVRVEVGVGVEVEVHFPRFPSSAFVFVGVTRLGAP